EEKIVSMINEHEITKRSYETAKNIESNSRKRSLEIKNGTTAYVEEMLSNAEAVLEETLGTLRNNRNSMRETKPARLAVEEDEE
ncbi:MAG: hypothetical protein FWE47_02705, partial [Oscillospiraceae bacterium]|nr:hypothetical protein [Oscillospiraceae bacterium]